MTSCFALKTCEKDAGRAQLGNAQSLPKRPVTCRVKRCCCRAKIYVSGKLGERYTVPVWMSQSCGALARCLSLWRPSDSELLHPHVIWKRAASSIQFERSQRSDCCDRERRSIKPGQCFLRVAKSEEGEGRSVRRTASPRSARACQAGILLVSLAKSTPRDAQELVICLTAGDGLNSQF